MAIINLFIFYLLSCVHDDCLSRDTFHLSDEFHSFSIKITWNYSVSIIFIFKQTCGTSPVVKGTLSMWTCGIILFNNVDPVSHLNFTACQDFRKNPFAGHDTVADGVKDVAPGVADLADLCNFQQNFAPDL
jgi:hypothetical protein